MKEIYLVTHRYIDDDCTHKAFNDYESARRYFLQDIGEFFLDCIHDSRTEHEANTFLPDFLRENYSDGFTLNDGFGNVINAVPNEENFGKHGSYLIFNFFDGSYLELQVISLE